MTTTMPKATAAAGSILSRPTPTKSTKKDDILHENVQVKVKKYLMKLRASESESDSDAGASPSVSSEEVETSSVSSRSSSPGGLQICETKPVQKRKLNTNPTNCGKRGYGDSPNEKGRSRRKSGIPPGIIFQKGTPNQVHNSSISPLSSYPKLATPIKIQRVRSSASLESGPNCSRKRKRHQDRTPKSCSASPEDSCARRNLMNKRRRTKSERNSRFFVSKVKPDIPVPVREEDNVALDAEIDKFLEEKAMKNNLTATNVKSIIRHVITNNMVQKMIMSTVKKKSKNPDDSSDDEACYEPKLTRARTKLLLGNNTTSPPLWPLSSPAKSKPPLISETQVFIQHELPEDSSGEEYVPSQRDVDETHSEDEFSSSVASHDASDIGSPHVSTPGSSSSRGKGTVGLSSDLLSPKPFSCFKTPAIKPKCARRIMDSAVGQRTRSKLPLNDTPLEDLEMQLIPPDITTDMYDWGLSDNEDYLGFLKDFLRPGGGSEANNEACDDEEADPEYNIMEEEEEQDKEELRMDRAVKVSKKELNELFAELLEESHFPSGDELNETDFTSFCASQLSHMSIPNNISGNNENNKLNRSSETTNGVTEKVPAEKDEMGEIDATNFKPPTPCSTIPGGLLQSIPKSPIHAEMMETRGEILELDGPTISPSSLGCTEPPLKQPIIAMVQPQSSLSKQENLERSRGSDVFNDNSRAILEHQLRQHVQLLSQSYALTITRDETDLKSIAQNAKRMIIEIRNIKIVKGESSIVNNVYNCDAAWQFINSWPVRSCARSPIKKKILVEQYMNECNSDWAEKSTGKFSQYFPRPVAKAIAESDAFIFPELLPTNYDQKIVQRRPFFASEDNLLVLGLDQLKDSRMPWKVKAEVIAATILTCRPAKVVYERIRNLRKKKTDCESQIVKDYFEYGQLPAGAILPLSWDPDLAVAPIRQPRQNLPSIWEKFIFTLSTEPENGGSVESFKSTKGRSAHSTLTRKSASQKTDNDNTTNSYITTTFPIGISMVQQHAADHPDMTAIPVTNINGDAEVYMFIPNYALPPTPTGNNSSPRGTEAITHREFYHPVPFYKPAANEAAICEEVSEIYTGTHHTPTNQDPSFISLTPVGIPISLPGMDSDFINISALNTPMRKAVMEHIEVADSEYGELDISQVDGKRDSVSVSDRAQHSARTFGNYESSAKLNSSTCSSSSNNTSSSSSSESDEDVENGSPSVDPVVITLDDDVDIGHFQGKTMEISFSKCADTNESNPQKSDGGKSQSSPSGIRDSNTSEEDPSLSAGAGSDHMNSQNANEGDDDGEDDPNPSKEKIKDVPDDAADDEMDKEEDTEEDQEQEHAAELNLTPAISSKPSSSRRGTGTGVSTKRKTTSCKRGSISPPKKRISTKGISVESMLEDDEERDNEVYDAFLKAFMHKIQITTQSNHPNIHNEFHKILSEAGDTLIDEQEILARVTILFKDYPQLVTEFSTFMKQNFQSDDEVADFNEYEDMEARLNFCRHLEKFTEKSPKLKEKILKKLKIVNENPSTTATAKDISDALLPYFHANPVMINAFQGMLPSLYLPGSVSDPVDFEELDMENEDPDVELMSLPEEKTIPATATCPCMCHETATHAYSSRVRHCNKCCIKFQDGKVFVHSGRIVRPVNVELLSPSCARKLSTEIHSTTPTTANLNVTPLTIKPDKPVLETEETDDKNTSSGVESEVQKSTPTNNADFELEDGQIVNEDEDYKRNNQKHNVSDSSPVPVRVDMHAGVNSANDNSTIVSLKPWSYEEDDLIICTWKAEPSDEHAFSKLESLLPIRDRTEIESRCVELLTMYQSMNNPSEGEIEENISPPNS